ncbi:MAG: glycine cleavage system protein GcvH [bacterium]|nr:glycine cleavage system protein GcvH [bacterium]
MYPQDYRYSKDHEWVRDEEDTVVVGITDFAQSELGDVVYVELPEVGATFETDDEVGTIESVKAVAEVYTPLAGEVVEINEALVDGPEKVNDDPHGEGWLFQLRVSSPGQADQLMTAEAYEAFIQSEG